MQAPAATKAQSRATRATSRDGADGRLVHMVSSLDARSTEACRAGQTCGCGRDHMLHACTPGCSAVQRVSNHARRVESIGRRYRLVKQYPGSAIGLHQLRRASRKTNTNVPWTVTRGTCILCETGSSCGTTPIRNFRSDVQIRSECWKSSSRRPMHCEARMSHMDSPRESPADNARRLRSYPNQLVGGHAAHGQSRTIGPSLPLGSRFPALPGAW